MPYEREKTSPDMIVYYEEQRGHLKELVDEGVYKEINFDDGTTLYTGIKKDGKEFGVAISVNGLIIRDGDMVEMKKFSYISKLINLDTSEELKHIMVNNFKINYYGKGIDFSHQPKYMGDNMKLTEIVANVTAEARQQKQALLRQKQMAVSG